MSFREAYQYNTPKKYAFELIKPIHILHYINLTTCQTIIYHLDSKSSFFHYKV